MYLKRNRKKKKGVTYESWSLVESVRTARGPRQRNVAVLGKLPGLDEEARVGWEHIGRILDGKHNQQDFLKPLRDPPRWARVDLSRVSVERLRRFGEVYLGLALWRRLKLHRFFDQIMSRGHEEVPWSVMACILTLARFCAPSSELQIAESWYEKTALDDLLGVSPEKINDDRLYRALDALLPYKEKLFSHLQKMSGEMFGIKYNFLLYDVTSTYFEGMAARNGQAKRGYSRDSRPDCVQVCIGLVVTPEGFPIAYEVFDGNRNDVTTVEEIVETMEKKYGQAGRVWVMDRGMVSEENLEMLREIGAEYLVGAPRSMLKKFEKDLLEKNWTEIQPGLEVKACRCPDGSRETYILCRSPKRREKEKAMRGRHIQGIENGLERLQKSTEKGYLRDPVKVERRIGKLFQRYSRAARYYEVVVSESRWIREDGKKLLSVKWKKKNTRTSWAELCDGCYLLRTNITGRSPEELWRIYIGLTRVEDSFRITKHDLGIRPVYHQKEDRTHAHIMICFLALSMWRTLEHWMKSSGLGTAPRKFIEEMREVKSLDVVLPTDARKKVRLRVVSKPQKKLSILLNHLDFPLPNKPKFISNVVANLPLF